MPKKKKVVYDVFDVDLGEWEESITLEEAEKEMLSFSECFEYYQAERAIARKLFSDMLRSSQKELIEEAEK